MEIAYSFGSGMLKMIDKVGFFEVSSTRTFSSALGGEFKNQQFFRGRYCV
jgi:hypothetical protein